MKLGEQYRQLKADLIMAEALYDRWETGDLVECIKRDYVEASVAVLEELLDTHPELWKTVDSLE